MWHLTTDTWHLTPDAWHLTPDAWHLTPDTWHLTPDTWHLTPDTWHLTPDTWHLTPDTWHLTPKSWDALFNAMPKLKWHHSFPQLTLNMFEIDNFWKHNSCHVLRYTRMTCNNCAFTLPYMCTAEAIVSEENTENYFISYYTKWNQGNTNEPKETKGIQNKAKLTKVNQGEHKWTQRQWDN